MLFFCVLFTFKKERQDTTKLSKDFAVTVS